MGVKRWFPGWRQPELQLQTVETEKEHTPMSGTPGEPNEEVVDVLREAYRDGMFFAGRKYRTRLAKLVQTFRERNTPEFFVAATELEEMLVQLRSEDPAKLDD